MGKMVLCRMSTNISMDIFFDAGIRKCIKQNNSMSAFPLSTTEIYWGFQCWLNSKTINNYNNFELIHADRGYVNKNSGNTVLFIDSNGNTVNPSNYKK